MGIQTREVEVVRRHMETRDVTVCDRCGVEETPPPHARAFVDGLVVHFERPDANPAVLKAFDALCFCKECAHGAVAALRAYAAEGKG